MWRISRLSVLLMLATLLIACSLKPVGFSPTATLTPVGFSPTATLTPAGSQPTTAPTSSDLGYLSGHATIGPLTPNEQAGEPTPTPSPAICMAYGVIISYADTQNEAAQVNFRADCTFLIALSPRLYMVTLQPIGIARSLDLPKTVTIQRGQAIHLEIDIDTGIR
jgi:hypothetical protein